MRYLKHLLTSIKYNRIIQLYLLTVIVIVIAAACEAPPAEEPCDICVDESLQAFYDENGGAEIFGKPHTPLLVDPNTNQRIQYFDGVRLEYSPNNPSEIMVGNLGEWAMEGLEEPIEAELPDNAPSRTFPNGYTIQGAFLEFYEANNGEQLFGDPISEQLNEGLLRVQYFENVRLEWHPDAPPGRKVQVSFLGRAHYLYEVYGFGVLQAAIPDGEERPREIANADVTAAVSNPTLYGDDQQIIFVIVESLDKQPASNLQVTLTITDGDETYTQVLEQLTNSQGTTQGVIEAKGWEPSEDIRVSVEVNYPNKPVIGRTSISFQKWWSN